jgi:hypothetical protein
MMFLFAVRIFQCPSCESRDFATKHSIQRKFAPIAGGLGNSRVMRRTYF